MGFREVSLAFDFVDGLAPGPKLLLVALADRANEDGKAWPSIRELQRRACLSRATVFRQLQVLEELGLVSISQRRKPDEDGRSRQTTNCYTLDLEGMKSGKYRNLGSGSQNETLKKKRMSASGSQNETLKQERGNNRRSSSGSQNETLKSSGSQKTGFQGLTGETPMKDQQELPTIPPTPFEPEPEREPPAPVGNDGGATAVASGGAAAAASVEESSPPRVGERSGAEGTRPAAAPTRPGKQPLATAEDWELVTASLPAAMRQLPGRDVHRIAGLLRARLAAGWSVNAIHATLASRALPQQVRSLPALVTARLNTDVPVDAPPPEQATAAMSATGATHSQPWSATLADGRVVRAGDVAWGSVYLALLEALDAGEVPEGMTKKEFFTCHPDPSQFLNRL